MDTGPTRFLRKTYSSCVAGAAPISRDVLGTPEGLRAVRDYAASAGAHGLVAGRNEVCEWLARGKAFFDFGCKLLMPPADVLRWVGSKCRQLGLATKVGFDALPTTFLENENDCSRLTADRFPVALRPDCRRTGIPSFKVKIARSPAELRSMVHEWGGACGPLIAQPLAALPNLVVHGARAESGEILAMRAFLVPRKFEGITLTISPAEFPPGIERCCRDFAASAGLTGCFHFELLFDRRRNRTWFLEVNVRLGGTSDKVAALGYDESRYLLQAYGITGAKATRLRLKRGVAADRRQLLKHAIRAAGGKLEEIDYPNGGRAAGLLRSLRDMCLARDSVLDLRDWRGSFRRMGRFGRRA
jgi:hypothetical protein